MAMLGLAAGVAFSGCATGQYTYVARTYDGQRLEFPLEKGMPRKAVQGSIEILNAGLLPTRAKDGKTVVYMFAYTDQSGVPAKSVVVEDVAGEAPVLLVEDKEPKLEKNRWMAVTPDMQADNAAVAWLGQLGDTMRIFRFTITKADGRKVVIHQGWLVPAWMKAAMRSTLGLPQL